ncbi:hypothetical protein ACQP1W_37275 [Spirillospora sp. CA-255316]
MSYDVRPGAADRPPAPPEDRPADRPAGAPVARAARTRRDRRRFVEFPYRLHRADPAFVPPLRRDCRRLLDRRRNPFFAYGEVELFTVEARGRVAGRIAAVHNPRHNEVHRARDGFFGLFECVDDPAVAGALFDAAAHWLRGRGLRGMLGPVSFTMNDECGLLVDGFGTPARVLMPYNPEYYPALLERCGLRKAKDLWTWERDSVPLDPRLVRLAEHVQRRNGLSARPVNLRDFDAELARIKRVYDSAWQDNWGFVPMTDAELGALARRLRRIVDPGLVQLVEAGGEPVAVGVGLPDLNQALPAARGRLTTFGVPIGAARLALAARRVDRVRGVLFGVVAEYRRSGLEALLYTRLWEAVAAGGYTGGSIEMGWTLEDNHPIAQSMRAIGGEHAKTYRIYRRDL